MKPGVYFMMGDEAAAEGAIAAGCRFYSGYPITPATEVMEWMAKRMPEVGGVFVQMEDELASIAAAIGASWAGLKAMTATSGPGFSLMQENIGLAFMTETPVVILNVQRVGPSTGRPTRGAQGDVMQARFGTHGDYEAIAFAPNSPQEMFDLTVKAFNVSEMLRTPVVVLADADVGHIREKVVIPEKVETVERKKFPPGKVLEPFKPEEDLVPPMPVFGRGNRVHVTGLSHSIKGYPIESPEEHDKLIKRLFEKIRRRKRELFEVEVINEESKVRMIAFGFPSRAAMEVVKRNSNVGLIRLKTVWPLDEEKIGELIQGSKVLVIEQNMGQLFYEIRRIGCEYGAEEVAFFNKLGGEAIYPREIKEAIERWL